MVESTSVAGTKFLLFGSGIGVVATVAVGGFMAWYIWKNTKAISDLEAQLVGDPQSKQQLMGLQKSQTSLKRKIEQLETELSKLKAVSSEETGLFSSWFKERQPDKQT